MQALGLGTMGCGKDINIGFQYELTVEQWPCLFSSIPVDVA